MHSPRIIKKYPNRRLYDTELGTYITLEDIKKLVLKHIDFQVVHAMTKKDLTQNTLLQIITEQENTSTPLFTNSMLQHFIRSYHAQSQAAFTQFLAQAIELFLHQNSFFQNQWSILQKIFSDFDKQKSMPTPQKTSRQPKRKKSSK